MKKIVRLAAAAAIGAGLAGMHGPAVAQDRDPFGFYGFYYGQCARDPSRCRAQPGCTCGRSPESVPTNRNERRGIDDKGVRVEPPTRIEITRTGAIWIQRGQAAHAVR